MKILGESKSKPLRLFCCDFPCENDLIFSFAMKASSEMVDLELVLFLAVPETGQRCRVILGSNQFIRESRHSWKGHYGTSNLDGRDLNLVRTFLENTRERHIFTQNTINDWQIR